MNENLLPEPVRSKNLTLEESRKVIHLRSWDHLQAACFLLSKQLLDPNEFQAYPQGYEVRLQELSKNPSVDLKLLEEIQKYKTKYPDIEDHYNALGRIKAPRLSGLKKNDEGNIIEAEPMVWIKLAKENNLFVAPAIDEAWIYFKLRAKKRYHPPKEDGSKKSIFTLSSEGMEGSVPYESQLFDMQFLGDLIEIASKNTKSNISKRFANARPMHEPSDIDNVQQLARNLFRENPCFTKQKIVQEICKVYPRAKCYNQCVLIKWLNWANIAPAKKAVLKNLRPRLELSPELRPNAFGLNLSKKFTLQPNEFYIFSIHPKLPLFNQQYKNLRRVYGRPKTKSINPCNTLE